MRIGQTTLKHKNVQKIYASCFKKFQNMGIKKFPNSIKFIHPLTHYLTIYLLAYLAVSCEYH